MKITRLIVSIALLVCLVSGCIITRTTVEDAPRQTAHFSSQKAVEAFYEGYWLIHCQGPPPGAHVRPVLYPPYIHQRYSTGNVIFNAAIRKADANADGIISEDEALAYLADAKKAGL